jgi:hypothetical protein
MNKIKVLRETWPGVNFRLHHGDVYWTDGPTMQEVWDLVGPGVQRDYTDAAILDAVIKVMGSMRVEGNIPTPQDFRTGKARLWSPWGDKGKETDHWQWIIQRHLEKMH